MMRSTMSPVVLFAVLWIMFFGSSPSGRAEGWTNKEIAAPPATSRIDYHKQDFAQGSFEVVLARGGPTGMYVWCHLHGRHVGRTGSTHYEVQPLVKDDGGYIYWLPAVKTLDVGGRIDAPDNNKHNWAQFKIPADTAKELKEAQANKVAIKAGSLASRDNAGIDKQIKEELEKLKNKKISPADFLKFLNKGKKPKKK